jgi:hypothetical protein
MPTDYSFTVYIVDPSNPPKHGEQLVPVTLPVRDQNDSGTICPTQGDMIGGAVVSGVWVGDRLTVTMNGKTVTITGVTFYRADAPAAFLPTDGTALHPAIFLTASSVNASTRYDLPPVPCFVADTMIFTAKGPRPAEALQAGDLLLTRDSGMRPVRWVGQITLDGSGRHAPIRFMPEAQGNTRSLLVSPDHRMLVTGWKAEMYFGETEVLVPAKTLVNNDTIRVAPCARVTYVHILLDRHEVIFAEGAATESLHPGDYLMAGTSDTTAEILALFPELAMEPGRDCWKSVRSIANAREAALLAA